MLKRFDTERALQPFITRRGSNAGPLHLQDQRKPIPSEPVKLKTIPLNWRKISEDSSPR
jgi:hypothetical protein